MLKATVANLEVKRPAGKWEKVGGASYDAIAPDPNTGIPRGLGLVTITGFTELMQENKDRQTFANSARPQEVARPRAVEIPSPSR